MKVITNAVHVVECLIREQPIGVTGLAEKLGLPKSSVYRMLCSLEDSGWVARQYQDHRLWVQTPRLWVLAQQGPGVQIRDWTMPAMEELNNLTGETIHTTESDIDDLVVIDKIETTNPIRVYDPVGIRVPLHQSSSGKAILSTWSLEHLEDYVRRINKKAEVALDEHSLHEELEEVRDRGYALNRGNWRPEISGIGVPLRINGLEAPASYGLAISIPTHRFAEESIPTFVQYLLQAQQDILERAKLQ